MSPHPAVHSAGVGIVLQQPPDSAAYMFLHLAAVINFQMPFDLDGIPGVFLIHKSLFALL